MTFGRKPLFNLITTPTASTDTTTMKMNPNVLAWFSTVDLGISELANKKITPSVQDKSNPSIWSLDSRRGSSVPSLGNDNP